MITLKLVNSSQNQAVRIPKNSEFKGVNEVYIRKEGEGTIIEPIRKNWLSYAAVSKADAEFMSARPKLL